VRRNGRRYAGACALFLAIVLAGTCVSQGIRLATQSIRASKRLLVSAIDVTGNRALGREEIVKAAGLQPGANLLDIHASRVRDVLRKLPAVERVTVRRSLPGRLSVRVVERAPVALVNVGRVYQVDDDGVLFDLGRGAITSLPVVTGLRDTVGADGVRRLSAAGQRRLRAFREAMGQSDPDWAQHLSQVEFSGNGTIRLTLDGHEAVVEMDGGDVTTRLNQLRRLLEVLAEEEGGAVRGISLCRNNVAYVRRAK